MTSSPFLIKPRAPDWNHWVQPETTLSTTPRVPMAGCSVALAHLTLSHLTHIANSEDKPWVTFRGDFGVLSVVNQSGHFDGKKHASGADNTETNNACVGHLQQHFGDKTHWCHRQLSCFGFSGKPWRVFWKAQNFPRTWGKTNRPQDIKAHSWIWPEKTRLVHIPGSNWTALMSIKIPLTLSSDIKSPLDIWIQHSSFQRSPQGPYRVM